VVDVTDVDPPDQLAAARARADSTPDEASLDTSHRPHAPAAGGVRKV
jgi:hypothetical protein